MAHLELKQRWWNEQETTEVDAKVHHSEEQNVQQTLYGDHGIEIYKANRIEGPRLFAQTNRPIPMRLFPTALDLIIGDAEEDEQDTAPLHENES